MERQVISNPKLDALLVLFVLAFMTAILSPVVLEYSSWRWPVCIAFVLLAVGAVVARRRIAAKEEKKVYRELRPRSRAGRRFVAAAYALFGLVAFVGVIAFAKIANDAFRRDRPRLGFQMASLCVASAGVIGAVVRGVRLQLKEEADPAGTDNDGAAPRRV
jgi:MFS family permease